MIYDQQEFDIRCEWGLPGVDVLASISDIVIIVDVLSFSTSVEIAVSRGAVIYPFANQAITAQSYADSIGAKLAESRTNTGGYSLSPESLMSIPKGTHLVLPSLNGSTLSMAAKPVPLLAGCLRNAAAIAAAAMQFGHKIAVIPAGERWKQDGSLRPALEDLIGAGAIIRYLPGLRSLEAQLAVTAFEAFQSNLAGNLMQCSSGKELIARGFSKDVELASMLDVSQTVPFLLNDAFVPLLP